MAMNLNDSKQYTLTLSWITVSIHGKIR